MRATFDCTSLLTVRSGDGPRAEVGSRALARWRKGLHHDFQHALTDTQLSGRPGYGEANEFLVKARREIANHSPI